MVRKLCQNQWYHKRTTLKSIMLHGTLLARRLITNETYWLVYNLHANSNNMFNMYLPFLLLVSRRSSSCPALPEPGACLQLRAAWDPPLGREGRCAWPHPLHGLRRWEGRGPRQGVLLELLFIDKRWEWEKQDICITFIIKQTIIRGPFHRTCHQWQLAIQWLLPWPQCW